MKPLSYRPLLRPSTTILVAALVFGAAVAAAKESDLVDSKQTHYQLGRGLEIPKYDLTIGGYANLTLRGGDEQSWRLSAEDLSLFLTWSPSERWLFFSEIEVGEAVTVSDDGIRSRDADFDLERLYADYSVSQALTLRVGKFLTPIGKWNVVHAAPLVWTTSRPLITQRTFARQATGAMLHGTLTIAERDLDYSLYADDSDDLDPEREKAETVAPQLVPANNFDNAFGANLRYRFFDDQVELGLSYANFEMEGLQTRQNLLGADIQWQIGRTEISAEGLYRFSSDDRDRDEWGAFIQGVTPIVGNLYGVLRGEVFESSYTGNTARLGTVGLAYRPIPPITLKVERLLGDDNAQLSPDGWFGSIAILF